MLIIGSEGYLPIQKNAARLPGPVGAGQVRKMGGRYDSYSPAAGGQEEIRSFREAVSSLSYQVRTETTTGKIQELRREVRSGTYQISPREIAARMLLMEDSE